MGGRGIIDDLMTKYGSPSAHPLSKDNLFIVAPGFLSGTAISSSGRLSVGGKSPLTGGIKEANVGGPAGQKLMQLGIQAIMVTGKASGWKILKIGVEGISFETAEAIVGLGNYAACEKLYKEYGKQISIILVGPAGERKYLNSTVAATDADGNPCRHAARGGVGAIMGSKLLKAIVIDSTGVAIRKPVDKDGFKNALKKLTETMMAGPHGTPGDFLKNFGTPGIVDVDNIKGSLPTYNFRQGNFDKHEKINAERYIELNKQRGGRMGHACMPGCIVRCSNIFHDSNGEYLTASLEYETLAMLGSNLGIDDLDAIARMDRKCDDLGLDTIETGCCIGILNDVGLFSFGDIAKAESLIDEIAQATPLGRILGSGTEVTAKVFGINRVPTVKGQGIPGHEPRALKGWGVTYATSPQGADHTAGPSIEDPLSPVGQVERSKSSQIINTAFDATGLCHFTFLYKNPDVVIPVINAFYGINVTMEDFMNLGKKMLREEIAFNRKAGIGPAADRLPDWMRKEQLSPTNEKFDVPQKEIDEIFDF
ncbi:MAG: aldehyde ferredoxin oxidoreductase C-terminal domain-containing protein [Acidobacteriota bacterium]